MRSGALCSRGLGQTPLFIVLPTWLSCLFTLCCFRFGTDRQPTTLPLTNCQQQPQEKPPKLITESTPDRKQRSLARLLP